MDRPTIWDLLGSCLPCSISRRQGRIALPDDPETPFYDEDVADQLSLHSAYHFDRASFEAEAEAGSHDRRTRGSTQHPPNTKRLSVLSSSASSSSRADSGQGGRQSRPSRARDTEQQQHLHLGGPQKKSKRRKAHKRQRSQASSYQPGEGEEEGDVYVTSVIVDPADYVRPTQVQGQAAAEPQQDNSVEVDVGSEYLSSVASSSSSGHRRSQLYKSRSSASGSGSGHTAPTSSSVLQTPQITKLGDILESPTLYEEDQDQTMAPLEDTSFH